MLGCVANRSVHRTVASTVEIHQRIEPLVGEWERLARRGIASPFLWPGWMEAWWHAFGAGRLQILTVYQDRHQSVSAAVAILPLLIHNRGAQKGRSMLSSTLEVMRSEAEPSSQHP